MRPPAANSDWRRLTRLDRKALNYITTRMHERYGDGLTLLDIEGAILDAFGIHVRIGTRGRELGVITIGFADIGVPEGSARAAHVRPPKMDLLPRETTDKITAAFARARDALPRFGVRLPATSLVWVPLPEWPECREAVAEIQADVARIVREELLDSYMPLREAWRERAREKAVESYRSLLDAGVEIEVDQDDFIARYVGKVLDAFPSYGQIQNGIDLFYETSRPSPEDLIQAVIAFRDAYFDEKARAADLEAAKKREAAERRKMLVERAEIWCAQAEQASALSEMAQEAGAEILKIALPVGEGLASLRAGTSRKLKNEIGRWLDATGALVSTQELDDLMRLVLWELDQPAKKRSAAHLRALLFTLSQELSRVGQPNALYAEIGAGVLSLQEI
jgi:hypothetical protein